MTKKSAQDPDRENSPAPRRKPRKKRHLPRLTTGQLITLLGTIAAILQGLGYVLHGR